jgi:hypothetical protein
MQNLNLKFYTCWSLTVGFISENTRDKRKYIDTLPEALGTINSKKKTASKERRGYNTGEWLIGSYQFPGI